jgi:hypothetical protein
MASKYLIICALAIDEILSYGSGRMDDKSVIATCYL